MRIPRIYLDAPMAAGNTVQLDERCAHYLANVLRMKAGVELVLFNGTGSEYLCVLQELSRKAGSVMVNAESSPDSESRLFTHLGIGL